MAAFLALLAFLQAAGVHVERVSVPGPHGVNLEAALVLPEGATKAPPVVALHGCGGPFPSRDGQWAVLLAKAGHIVLLPDSFGSRGLGSQRSTKEREVTPAGLRRDDAIDAAQWLAARPGTPPGGGTHRVVERRQHCAGDGALGRRSAFRPVPAIRSVLSRLPVGE